MDVAGPLTSSAIEGIKRSHNRDTAGAFTSGKLVLLSLSQDAAPQTDPAHLSCQSSLALVLLSCPSFYQHLPRASHSVKCIPKMEWCGPAFREKHNYDTHEQHQNDNMHSWIWALGRTHGPVRGVCKGFSIKSPRITENMALELRLGSCVGDC